MTSPLEPQTMYPQATRVVEGAYEHASIQLEVWMMISFWERNPSHTTALPSCVCVCVWVCERCRYVSGRQWRNNINHKHSYQPVQQWERGFCQVTNRNEAHGSGDPWGSCGISLSSQEKVKRHPLLSETWRWLVCVSSEGVNMHVWVQVWNSFAPQTTFHQGGKFSGRCEMWSGVYLGYIWSMWPWGIYEACGPYVCVCYCWWRYSTFQDSNSRFMNLLSLKKLLTIHVGVSWFF